MVQRPNMSLVRNRRLFKVRDRRLRLWVREYGLPTAMALLFLWFWMGSQSVDLSEHNRYVSVIRQLQEQDARMNQSLLQLRLGLINNYDSIVNKQATIQTLQQNLEMPPDFASNRSLLSAQAQENRQIWAKKNELVQQFNTSHSVLLNSLAYFPIAIADLIKDPNTSPPVATRASSLLEDILLFNLSTTEEIIAQIERDIQQLSALSDTSSADAPGTDASGTGLANVLAHANIILEKRLETDAIVAQALALPTREQGTAIAQTYDTAYQRAVRAANFHRFGLYLLLTALVIAIAASIISKLRQTATMLQQSENTQRALFQTIPDLMLRMYGESPIYDVVSANSSIALSESSNRSANLYDVLPLAIVEQRLEAAKQALETKTTQVYEQYLEREGEGAWEEVRVVPCGKKDVLVMIRDIRDRKQAEAALQKATAEAQVANKAKSQFLANMSHELRTPLNVILGFAQLMTRNGALNLQQKGHLDSISQSGEHLLSLINDVLEMSKIEAGKVTLNQNDFDLRSLLVGIHTMFQYKAHSKGIALYMEDVSHLPHYIRADESKLRQVLVNLVGNAVKFTGVGSVRVRAWVESACEENEPVESAEVESADLFRLNIEVEDTGPGVCAEDMAALFDPFVQAKQTQALNHAGTGLGLPISRKFVELMGGEIMLSSEVGAGSRFCFYIQAAPASGRTLKQNLPSQSIVGLVAGQPTYRILVVEDLPKNRQLLIELLAPIGFDVRAACDGLEAVKACQTWRPHLIWMDLRMPVMDGYEATRLIKGQTKENAASAPVVIALTGSAFTAEKQAAIAAGCDDFVSKPFRTEIIFEKIATFLNVQYTYSESVTAAVDAERNGASPARITYEDLQVMPAAWREALNQAATKVSDTEVARLLSEVPSEQHELANYIHQLVEDFSFEEIVNLTKARESGI